MSNDGDRLDTLDEISRQTSTRTAAPPVDGTEEKAVRRRITQSKISLHALNGLLFLWLWCVQSIYLEIMSS